TGVPAGAPHWMQNRQPTSNTSPQRAHGTLLWSVPQYGQKRAGRPAGKRSLQKAQVPAVAPDVAVATGEAGARSFAPPAPGAAAVPDASGPLDARRAAESDAAPPTALAADPAPALAVGPAAGLEPCPDPEVVPCPDAALDPAPESEPAPFPAAGPVAGAAGDPADPAGEPADAAGEPADAAGRALDSAPLAGEACGWRPSSGGTVIHASHAANFLYSDTFGLGESSSRSSSSRAVAGSSRTRPPSPANNRRSACS